MKKILLTATMLVCFTAISKAQQGRVGINTTTPATTLDVVADATNTSKPDALLVPRLTRTQLYGKDAAYDTAQNGALAFVTTIDGTATAKTTNVTAVGFYYYDAPSSTWKVLGGGGVDTSIYLNDGNLAGPRTVNQSNNNLTFTTGTGQFIVNGTTNLKGGLYTNIRVESNANFTIQPNDYMIHYTAGGSGGTVTLPAATEAGRELCFFAENAPLSTGALGNGANVQPGYGTCIISTGTIWITKSAL